MTSLKLISLLIRLALTGALIYWVWLGSRIALVITLSLVAIAVELLNLTTPVTAVRQRHDWW